MKKISSCLFVVIFFVSCNQKAEQNDTILKGKISILVDETIKPIVEDEVMVFESAYEAKVSLIAKSENEIMQSLSKNQSQVAVMPRKLSTEEQNYFLTKKINPKVTPFAKDALIFISNKRNSDTLINLQDVLNFMKGSAQTKIKGLVFDNPNSSTVRYMNNLASLKETPAKGIYSFKTNEEVIKYVAENDGMIGVVGVNWLQQPTSNIKDLRNKITILSVKENNNSEYYYPSQNNIAEGKYALARDLYIINCQGYSGLGMGLSSFIAGERGQRIVLKSGLVPFNMPGRKISIRKEIIKKTK